MELLVRALVWHTKVLSYLVVCSTLFMVVGLVAIIRDTRAIAAMTAEVLRRTAPGR